MAIQQGIQLVETCEHFYLPDGLYPEGPGYWHYGTNYHVLLLAACETLDHPVKVTTLLEKSGNSMIHLDGPTLLPFNFSDGHAKPSFKSPAQSWIASHFKNAGQAKDTRERLHLAFELKKKTTSSKTSPIINFSIGDNPATASMDLSSAYANTAEKVIRSVSFDESTGIALINVEIRP